ncbi:MAG: nucleotidyltransferase family protein [Rhodospirillales bacterium]|jgi:MurNAc alpha-1-phosphate uridylyltransferase|tara:strand:+ start:3308 stop:4054 length:747 start_codon:yes stop_codon:yes gene_type:complete
MNTITAPLKTAMILAAGLGTRMRPITAITPKPLVKVDGRTLIDHAIDRLVEGGVTDVVVNLHYLGDQVERQLNRRENPKIKFSWERDELLETGGGVKHALGQLGSDPFWVINCDSLWLNGPQQMMTRALEQWDPEKMDALLILHSTVDANGYEGQGDFHADPNGQLTRRPELEVSPWLFTGLQILNPRVFTDTPDGAFSLNVVYNTAIEAGRLYGMVHDGEWFHVGTPEGLGEVEGFMKYRYAGVKHR